MDKEHSENYFRQFPDDLIRRIELMEDDLLSVAPTLMSQGKKNIYKLPEGYFDNNRAVVFRNTIGATRIGRSSRFPATLFAIAAMVLLLLTVFAGRLKDTLINDSLNKEQDQLELAVFSDDEEHYDGEVFVFSNETLLELELLIDEDKGLDTDELTVDELELFYNHLVSEYSAEELSDEELSEFL